MPPHQGHHHHHGPSSSSLQTQNNSAALSASAAASAAAAADLPLPQRPRVRRVESSSSEDSLHNNNNNYNKARSPTNPHFQQPSTSSAAAPAPPFYASFANNSSTASLQNFSRPTPSPLHSAAAAAAARSVTGSYDPQQRNASPLSVTSSSTPRPTGGAHSRKHSQTAGVFEPTLPSISTSNLATHVSMSSASPVQRDLPASHIAAQAAVLSHQQSQQTIHHHHSRQRSQTVPTPSEHLDNQAPPPTVKRTSGPLNPPVLSLTEASAPRETGFGSQGYHNGLLGSNAAATAANMAFPRSGPASPTSQIPPQPPPPPPPLPDKKPEKSSKVKLFSRPGKIGVKAEPKDKPLPSPSKIGSALSALQRGNFSTTSLDTSAQSSFYGVSNASSATIRPPDAPPAEKEGKEKKHHFLSRQRHKAKDKDDYHSQLSSAASNSRPTDPTAPSSLYNFNLPSSPAPNSSAFKNISALDLRHGKKKEYNNESAGSANGWAGPGSLGSTNNGPLYQEPLDSSKYGLNSMSYDDAWPYLRAKLLVIFEGEDLRLPVEDFNRVVSLHLEYCIRRRLPNQILDDLRSLLETGFLSLDINLRKHSEERLIPNLVDLWIHVFTAVLPYMQAVFLPLDQEFAGCGEYLKSAEQAKEFWGGVVAGSPLETTGGHGQIHLAPASSVLDVRRLVLAAYRDVVVIPRYDRLKTVFSRLSLDFFPGTGLASPLAPAEAGYFAAAAAAASPSAESATTGSFPFHHPPPQARPGTAMSLDPSTGSYTSQATTLLGDMASASAHAAHANNSRSRGLSNVSFASSGAHSNGADSSLSLRPPPGKLGTPGAGGTNNNNGNSSMLGALSLREQNVEDSKYVTDMVGRMLQCMSVLATATSKNATDEGTSRVQELGRLLKLNWLGRGRTGRNRRGIVGGRVARRGEGATATVREEIAVS